MNVFAKLRALRAFERRHLPFLRTLEDFDLIEAIGYHQEIREPVTLKVLLAAGIGSAATVQRRLRRLKALGAVHARPSKRDRRSVELVLSPKVRRRYAKLATVLDADAPRRAGRGPRAGAGRRAATGDD